MLRHGFGLLGLALLGLALTAEAASAQRYQWGESGPNWGPPRPRYQYAPPPQYRAPPPPDRYWGPVQPYRPGAQSFLDDPTDRRRGRSSFDEPPGLKLMDGGGRPDIAPIATQSVPFASKYDIGTIIIEQSTRQLFLVASPTAAIRYPISVGRDGFTWTGEEKISRIADWPDWHPPAEMRERDPKLPEKMTGGVKNPLGAKSLYLGTTLYRIHGTNDAKTIGLAASSGCFRMLNGHVIDLAARVEVGSKVVVVDRLAPGTTPSQSPMPRPQPRRG